MAELFGYESIGFRTFSFEGDDPGEVWRRIQTATGLLTDWGVKHLEQGFCGELGTVLVERPYVCEDFRSLHRDFYGRKFRERSSRCARLHFFSQPGLGANDVLFGDCQSGYIGSSVIEPLQRRCIGRTVIDPFQLGKKRDSFHVIETEFRSRIGGKEYLCRGFPYRTQNDEATVCAHVVMWAVCRYLSQRYPQYRQLLPFDLIEMAGRSNGRVVPYQGMTYADYSEILHQFGCQPVVLQNHGIEGDRLYRRTSLNQKEFNNFCLDLYSYVESGFPVIASFGTHVANIIGHTSVSGGEAARICSRHSEPVHASELVDRYVVMDDNYFPYQMMSKLASPAAGDAYPRSVGQILTIVVPLPEEAYLRPSDVRDFATRFIDQPPVRQIVAELLASEGSGESLVYRPFLTSGASWKARKREQLLDSPADVALQYQLRLSLPKFIWVVELSTASLRQQNKAFGEIVLDATAGESDLDPVFGRFGSHVALHRRHPSNSGLDYADGNSYKTFYQFRHNLGQLDTNV